MAYDHVTVGYMYGWEGFSLGQYLKKNEQKFVMLLSQDVKKCETKFTSQKY
jgi:hypothetical protein